MVQNGVVTLNGRVTMPFKAEEIGQLAARVTGVREVLNNIKTLPYSLHDEELRRTIATLIYREPMFFRYSTQPDPPIHIIVENGRVTLTGVVASQAEKIRAEQIVRGVGGVFGIENRLRVES
jgi:hyperosmotically inducible protein